MDDLGKIADEKAMIYEHMPVNDMIKKGWLPKGAFPNLKKAVMAFWGMETLDFTFLSETYQPFYSRKSEAYNQYNANYALTWFQKAQSEAAKFEVSAYDKDKLETLLINIADYTVMADGINQFINELTACGVIFFILPHLEKTYLDGAAFYAKNNPVVVYTGRHKRVDNYWFTIAHEIAHVLLHLNADRTFILDNLDEDNTDEVENEANALAAKYLKHAEIMRYMGKLHANAIPMMIEMCAQQLKIGKSIVAGKMLYEKKLHGSKLRLYSGDVISEFDTKYLILT
jgi:HTH-type transcriptional regulator/antitoxin HigA